MSQELVGVTPPSTPGPEQSHCRETDSLAHTAESVIVPPTQPEGFPQIQKGWGQLVRDWVFIPSVGVFVALVVVATIYFCPVIISKAPNGETDYDLPASDASVRSQNAASQDALTD